MSGAAPRKALLPPAEKERSRVERCVLQRSQCARPRFGDPGDESSSPRFWYLGRCSFLVASLGRGEEARDGEMQRFLGASHCIPWRVHFVVVYIWRKRDFFKQRRHFHTGGREGYAVSNRFLLSDRGLTAGVNLFTVHPYCPHWICPE